MKDKGFETKSLRMERLLEVSVFAPEEDADRIMEHVCEITPLAQGESYDRNAQQSAPGIERYRPREGAVAGPETEVRKRPGIVALSFELPDDQALLEEVVEALEPVGRQLRLDPGRGCHHCSSRMPALRPEPIPMHTTESPGDRSSATAARVIGTAAGPMFP